MGQTLTGDQRASLTGVHYLIESDEAVHLRVFRQESSDRWKAQLSGRAFSFAARTKQLEDAARQVVTWFRRAFPHHVCNPKCQTQAFRRVEEKLVEDEFVFNRNSATSNSSIPETQNVPSLDPSA